MKIFIVILFLSSTHLAKGQFHTPLSRSELGVIAGGMTYIGDLKPYEIHKDIHLSLGMVYRYNINPRTAFRANFLYGNVSADDAKSSISTFRDRNLNFHSDIYELGAGFEFNYYPFQLGHERYKATAYLLAEIAFFRMNPKTDYLGNEIELRTVGTEGQGTSASSRGHYKTIQFAIPIGVGVKFSLGKRIGFNLELGIRKTFTDYLDDVHSASYVDPNILLTENGPLAAALSNRSGRLYGQRGNPSNKDWYLFAGGMLTFQLGKPAKCYNH